MSIDHLYSTDLGVNNFDIEEAKSRYYHELRGVLEDDEWRDLDRESWNQLYYRGLHSAAEYFGAYHALVGEELVYKRMSIDCVGAWTWMRKDPKAYAKTLQGKDFVFALKFKADAEGNEVPTKTSVSLAPRMMSTDKMLKYQDSINRPMDYRNLTPDELEMLKIWFNWYIPPVYDRTRCSGAEPNPEFLDWFWRRYAYEVFGNPGFNGPEKAAELTCFLRRWLAQRLQYPFTPSQVCVILKGREGCGKSTMYQMLCRLLYGAKRIGDINISGGMMTRLLPGAMSDKFSSAVLEGKVFLFLEEFTAKDAAMSNLMKNLITSETLLVRKMHQHQSTGQSYLNIVITTNDRNPVDLGEQGERRYAVYECSSELCGRFESFWTPFRNAILEEPNLLAWGRDLYELPGCDPETWKPMYRIPKVKTITHMKLNSASAPLEFLIDVVSNKANFWEYDDLSDEPRYIEWRDKVPLSHLYQTFVKFCRLTGRPPMKRANFKQELAKYAIETRKTTDSAHGIFGSVFAVFPPMGELRRYIQVRLPNAFNPNESVPIGQIHPDDVAWAAEMLWVDLGLEAFEYQGRWTGADLGYEPNFRSRLGLIQADLSRCLGTDDVGRPVVEPEAVRKAIQVARELMLTKVARSDHAEAIDAMLVLLVRGIWDCVIDAKLNWLEQTVKALNRAPDSIMVYQAMLGYKRGGVLDWVGLDQTAAELWVTEPGSPISENPGVDVCG